MSKVKARLTGEARWRSLERILTEHRPQAVLLGVVSFSSAMLEAGFLVLVTGTAVAIVNGSASVELWLGLTVPPVAALWAAGAVLLLRLAASLASVHLSSLLTVRATTALRRRLTHAYLRASWSVQQAEPTGRLQDLLTSFMHQIILALNAFSIAMRAALSLAALVIAAFLVNPLLTLAVFTIVFSLGAVLLPVRRRIQLRSARLAASDLRFANSISELGALGMEMQTYGVRDQFVDRIDQLTDLNAAGRLQVQRLVNALPQMYIFLAYSAFIAAVAMLQALGGEALSAAGTVMLLALRSLSYGQQLQSASGTLGSSLPFLHEVERTIGYYETARSRSGDQTPSAVTPITLDRVSVVYDSNRAALSEVSAVFESGEMVGVMGPSGAGKSTLAQLLLGLRQPTSGTVRVNAVDMDDVDRTSLATRVAFVAQDARLITGTVAENIRFFRSTITDEDLLRAADQAHLAHDIEQLPRGFDTHIGERGAQLSGGQRQRLSLARALAGNPELLVLDEPTSALDTRSEAAVRSALSALKGRVTVVIIAHRMSTLDMCDKILVLESGRLTASGTRTEVLDKSDFYRSALRS